MLSGCVRRSLTIRTEPPGALVYLNDKLKGESPVTYDFEWYGWYRVMIRKDGYQRLDDHKLLRAPICLWIPVDLAMELLPFPIPDRHTWSYTLVPSEPLPTPVPPEVSPPIQQPIAEPADGSTPSTDHPSTPEPIDATR